MVKRHRVVVFSTAIRQTITVAADSMARFQPDSTYDKGVKNISNSFLNRSFMHNILLMEDQVCTALRMMMMMKLDTGGIGSRVQRFRVLAAEFCNIYYL